MDGTEVCRRLRAEGDWTPILFVTARDDEVDRVVGLEMGADDYLTKPFSPRELVARVKTVLRRGRLAAADAENPVLVVGAVRLDPSRRRVWADGTEVQLTATEFDLLAHLMRRPGRVYEREQLLSAVWGYTAAAGTRTVDVHVAQVRAKLGDHSPIRTVRGGGRCSRGCPECRPPGRSAVGGGVPAGGRRRRDQGRRAGGRAGREAAGVGDPQAGRRQGVRAAHPGR